MTLVFRDRWFCNKDDCFKRYNCDRYFTEHLKKMAEKVRLPVSFSKYPHCYKKELIK